MNYLGFFLVLICFAGFIHGCITHEDILPSSVNGNQTEVMNFVVEDDHVYVFSRNLLRQFNTSRGFPEQVDQFEEQGYLDYGYFQNDQMILGNLKSAWVYDRSENGSLARARKIGLDDCNYSQNRVFNSNFDVIEFWEDYVLVGRLSRSADLRRTRCGADSLFLFRQNEEGMNEFLDVSFIDAQDILPRGNGDFLVLSNNNILEAFIRSDRLRLGDTVAYAGGQHFFENGDHIMVVRNSQLLVYAIDSLKQQSPIWTYNL